MARVLCETGFKDLFVGLFNEICENPESAADAARSTASLSLSITSTFDPSMSVEVNREPRQGQRHGADDGVVGDQERSASLGGSDGFEQPDLRIPEMLNTMTDMLTLANVKNVGRYFKTPNPQQLQQLLSAPKTPDPQAMAAQAMMEKVRSETAKAVGQQHLDRTRMEQENDFKHQQLQAKTQVDLQKLDMQGQQMGVDHHVALAQLASQLMKDQSDSEAQDQQIQLDMADSQMKQDQTAQQGQDAERRRCCRRAATMASHQQNMAKIAERPYAVDDAIGGGAPCGDDRPCDDGRRACWRIARGRRRISSMRRSQNDLDRQHQAATTDATLRQSADDREDEAEAGGRAMTDADSLQAGGSDRAQGAGRRGEGASRQQGFHRGDSRAAETVFRVADGR